MQSPVITKRSNPAWADIQFMDTAWTVPIHASGRNGWQIERCYIKEDVRQMIDIIAGPCFICDCSGSDFGSLSDEQLKRYVEQFKYPEHFFRTENGIKAVPYPPEKDQTR